MVPGEDSIPVLKNIRERNRYHYGNLVFKPNKNPILCTIIYELDFPDGCVE